MKEATCPNCGARFEFTGYVDRTYCSKKCSDIYRKGKKRKPDRDPIQAYKEQYNRAVTANNKIGRFAVEARKRGLSYGKLMVMKETTGE
jgi:predicted nucleic acid-binding Zn ribbon protein